MAFQIRLTAVLRSVNFLTGLRLSKGATPAKEFQTSTKRAAGHSAESLASSFSPEKAPSMVPTRWFSASSSTANAVMLLSVSMV
jgi:hypothetical protein